MIVSGQRIEELFGEAEIAREVERIAREIEAGLPKDGAGLLVLCVLKGAFVFTADLIRALSRLGVSPEVDFLSVSSYGAGRTSGELRLTRDIEGSVAGRDVVIVEDILESGRTLAFAGDLARTRGARSVRSVVLLDKRGHRKADIEPDHLGFVCPDKFVAGYGMDAGYRFRELPFVGAVTED
ncbi:hypoxanthine phosphoribosyltransferase [Fulvimarina endophytica]|uniref:Hypoxanthine phosphoribosyltransferase n=1 Tax=Fulvimarina endophytica TaxID=2293836 RepID=A0A371X511_9HYPH|nr:hypoxanthine phosphoribosyltransferase [Fulvimarina endophytica]RFC64310.1 hypoxanthine phosphoribosyltransferase [Fulvimarina endophytica]